MHVCVLTSVHLPFDGRIFHREAVSLAQAGYRVMLFAPATVREEREGVTVIGVPCPRHRWQRPLTWWRLYRHARRLRPDVIHFHDPELLLIVPLLRLVLGRRTRIVYDVHEYFVDSLAVKEWIPRGLRPLAVALAGRLERLFLRGVDALVLAVEGQRALYPDFRGPVSVVRNLPLVRLFEGAQPDPALDVPGLRLIYVGLILPKRGIDVLLEAMRLVHERGQDDVTLFLVGPETSRDYLHQIRTFTRAHNLERQVRWLGYVPHDRLKHYLASADAGVSPGLPTAQYSRPNISTKLLEYMLCGLPVLVVDNPHWRTFVDEARCGLVVPHEDPAAYADAILWLQDHPQEAREMGERGRTLVLDRFTWEQEEHRLLDLYECLRPGQKKDEVCKP